MATGGIGIGVKPSSGWEELLSKAKRLESQLDVGLSDMAQLSSSIASSTVRQKDPELGLAGMPPALAARAVDMTTSIESLLESLRSTNEAMSAIASGPSATIPQLHTVHRHREILNEYASEFRKVTATIDHYRETAELLSSVRRDISEYKSSGQGQALRETDSINNTDRITDALLGRADAARRAIEEDGRVFAGVNDRLASLGARFPLINSLMGKVASKKRRNMLILASTIALCAVLVLLYWLNK